MPVDPVVLRRTVEETERVTEIIRASSSQLKAKVDPCRSAETSSCCIAWARNVSSLKTSIDGQIELSQAMRESARIQDEQHGEHFRDRYRFLTERLKSDIRFFFCLVKDCVELPQDFNRQRTWNDYVYDMEMELKSITAANAGEHNLVSVDPVIVLLNYREKVFDLALRGILFQKAVLDWDMKGERAFADGPMVEMAEKVVEHYSKTDCVPAKLIVSGMPSTRSLAGHFSVVGNVGSGGASQSQSQPPIQGHLSTLAASPHLGQTTSAPANSNSNPAPAPAIGALVHQSKRPGILGDVQRRLMAALHEARSLDAQLRNIRFAERVHLDVRKGKSGSCGSDSGAAGELKSEYLRWDQRSEELETQLAHSRKSKGNQGLELKAEQVLRKLARKEQNIKEQVTSIHKLEGEWQSMKYELISLRRERNELQEKNSRMAKENMPLLEKMKSMLSKSQDAVDRLAADTAVLSEVFRLQVQEISKLVIERDKIRVEVSQMHKALSGERAKRKAKEEGVRSKETVYLRTMAARKAIMESGNEQRTRIENVNGKIRTLDQETEGMRERMNKQEIEMDRLSGELSRARRRIEELQQQKAACMSEYEALTGKEGGALLARFKAVPTLPL